MRPLGRLHPGLLTSDGRAYRGWTRARAPALLVTVAWVAFWWADGRVDAARFEVLTLVVHVNNQAGTATDVLHRAEAQTNRIFMEAGIRIAWQDLAPGPYDPRCEEFSILITLLAPDTVRRLSSEGLSETALGSAAEGTGRAAIYPQRILALGTRIHSSAGELLGRVIAHELGHLMLPAGHSPVGIMTAGLDANPRTSGHFTTPQARAIRTFLQSRRMDPELRRGCDH